MAVPFSTNAEDVIHREVAQSSDALQETNLHNWSQFYEVNRCIDWIIQNKFERVALQFPDEYLTKSACVARELTEKTNAEVFILADTSYGSCCVDEVAAQHYRADAIVHYGHTCLSPSDRLPVLYVYGRSGIDVSSCCSHVIHELPATSRVMVIFSVEYLHARDEVADRLSEAFKEVIIPDVILSRASGEKQSDDTVQEQSIFSMFSRQFSLPPDTNIEHYTIVYIGQETMLLTNMMLTFKENTFYSYNPQQNVCHKQSISVNKLLMKRFYLVEKVKDAQVVGILIATLSVSKYLEIVNRLKTLLKHAGKKYYIFSVGKINVPKLANFPDVDVYVLVSCPESVILDSTEYYSPIVTPFEVEMACDPDREWAGKLVLDFSSLLPGGADYKAVDLSKPVDTMDVSLITGSVRRLGVDSTQSVPCSDGTLVARDNMTLAAVTEERYSSKEWRGLDPQLGQSAVTKAVQGRKGIAIQYEEEPP